MSKGIVAGLVAIALSGAAFAQSGCRYLIISADQFTSLAQQLAVWKTQKGMLARVVPISEIGANSTSIQNCVRNAYNTWNPRPEYVLILGSPDYIPAYQNGYDTYYGDMSGDYEMEISVGRLPAWHLRECSTLVFKTLNYERPTSPNDTLWLLKGTTTVREDNPPDEYYQADSRILRNYWQAAGYVVAESLCDLYGHTSADVTAAANNGRAFITYRGVAGGMWWIPFNTINPYSWTNGAHMPVVVGATCATMTLAPGEELYADKFVRAGSPSGTGGAVAYFGTTQSTSSASRFRSAAYRGFFKSLYEEGAYRLGDATLRARFRIDSLYHDQTRYMEWNLLGDPELNVWTRQPVHTAVQYDSVVVAVPQDFTVLVTAGTGSIAGAVVCASMDSSIYAWAETDSTGRVNLPLNPSHTGTMKVVVTGRNLWPVEGTCRIAAPVHDVACTSLEAPAGVVDSGTVVVPACSVYNYGNLPETYTVRMRIGASYDNTAAVTNQAPHEYRHVTFPGWTASNRGVYAVSCSTRLDGDARQGNDRSLGSVRVRVQNVGVTRIVAPSGSLDSGQTVVPQSIVRNVGTDTCSFPVWFTTRLLDSRGRTPAGADDPAYEDSVLVTLAPGESISCDFAAWTATTPGAYATESFTALVGDLSPDDDTACGAVIVLRRMHDVGAMGIIEPVGIVGLGTIVKPCAAVANFGTDPETLLARFSIASAYVDTQRVMLEPGETDTLVFSPWVAAPVGIFVARCTTVLATDANPSNDMALDSFEVSVRSSAEETRSMPTRYALANLVPNPFNHQTVMRYGIPAPCLVELEVYSAEGRLVRRLRTGTEDAGYHEVVWNGCDDRGSPVRPGIYCCRLVVEGRSLTRKLTRVE
jgi:hypothetical protein